MKNQKKIIVKGARVHNLKNITVEIPKDKLIVITGVSGSGKSSLAFDTLYAEGQRRYIESLSSYARQFLGMMEKPDVDYIEGLSPAIAIEARKPSHNPRSTVGTTTEIYDYLRLLFARIGIPHCPVCGKKLEALTSDQIVDKILNSFGPETRIFVLAPIIKGRKGEYKELFKRYLSRGFIRVRVDKEFYNLEEEIPELEKYKKHDIEILIDRVKIRKDKELVRSRLAEAVEKALEETGGDVKILVNEKKELHFSEKFACPEHDIYIDKLEPSFFSFNSPYGACPECHGLGFKLEISAEKLVTNPNLSIYEGCCELIGEPYGWLRYKLEKIEEHYQIDLNKPFKKLPEKIKNIIFYGDNFLFEGIIEYLWRRYHETESDRVKEKIEEYMVKKTCPVCKGTRLKKEVLAVKIYGKSIWDIVKMDIKTAYEFFIELEDKLTEREWKIAHQIISEIKRRLRFLLDVGLYYLTLDRATETLSGGEEQRVRLATQIGSGLSGVLYILDEPTIGLHPRDTGRLIETLIKLRNLGNTIVVVEHDKQVIESADWVIDLGPGAGENGGKVVATGTPDDIKKNKKSLTGLYLNGAKKIPLPEKRRKPKDKWLVIEGAREHNLKNITVRIPLGLFVCITGVSGSGKSTLIFDTLYRALRKHLGYKVIEEPGKYDRIKGLENIDKVICIDQSPIGRTPRSNPATYVGAFTPIREFFAQLPLSRMRGYKPGRFSFNVRGGRCEACKGEGFVKIEMQFLPDVYIPCEVCKGKRYNRETLEVKYKGKSIADVLEMSVDEAYELFKNIPQIERKLKLLKDVGLGYIKLGQPATTLSGGEAQRIKLAKELSKIATGKTLYILDEPTTGLHFDDVYKLLNVLQRLVDKGNTVIVIEHNLDVIKSADWLIDLGPEGGEEGGYVVAEGPPEEVAMNPKSYTGKYLRKELNLE